MLIKRPADIRSSEISDKKLYLNRREFIRAAGVTGVAAAAGAIGAEALVEAKGAAHGRKLANIKKSPLSVADEKQNTWEQINGRAVYGNYRQFTTEVRIK